MPRYRNQTVKKLFFNFLLPSMTLSPKSLPIEPSAAHCRHARLACLAAPTYLAFPAYSYVNHPNIAFCKYYLICTHTRPLDLTAEQRGAHRLVGHNAYLRSASADERHAVAKVRLEELQTVFHRVKTALSKLLREEHAMNTYAAEQNKGRSRELVQQVNPICQDFEDYGTFNSVDLIRFMLP